MNTKQKLIILIGIILVIVAISFPTYKAQLFDFEYNGTDVPFWTLYENGRMISQSISIEFHSIFSPPEKIKIIKKDEEHWSSSESEPDANGYPHTKFVGGCICKGTELINFRDYQVQAAIILIIIILNIGLIFIFKKSRLKAR